MKLPESLFAFINPMMIGLLHSPVHGLMSASLMTISYTGAKTGNKHTVPVRYMRDGNHVCCTTSTDTGWWHNFRDPRSVQLRLEGAKVDGTATAVRNDPKRIEPVLLELWSRYPADAAYMNVKLDRGGRPNADDFERASAAAVLINIEIG